jgi:hypothetical protein
VARLLLNPRNLSFGEDNVLFKPGFIPVIAEFRERTHPNDSPLGRRLRGIHAAGPNRESLWLDAQMFALGGDMLQLVADERAKIDIIRLRSLLAPCAPVDPLSRNGIRVTPLHSASDKGD